jgi:hypothetical protein
VTATGFFQTGKRLGELDHGFRARVIECECGLRYPADQFERHLLDAAKDKLLLDLERALRPGTGGTDD